MQSNEAIFLLPKNKEWFLSDFLVTYKMIMSRTWAGVVGPLVFWRDVSSAGIGSRHASSILGRVLGLETK